MRSSAALTQCATNAQDAKEIKRKIGAMAMVLGMPVSEAQVRSVAVS